MTGDPLERLNTFVAWDVSQTAGQPKRLSGGRVV